MVQHTVGITTTVLALLCGVLVAEGRWEKEYRFDYTYNETVIGWLKLHYIPATWDEARLRCHAEGAVLASPLDEPLLNAMNDMVAKSTSNTNCGIFSGIHSTIYKGVYSSVEGIPLSKIPVRWAPGEPVSEYDEGCLLLVWNGTMAVGNCTDSYPYICYKKKTHYVKFTACGTDDKYQLNTKTGSCYKFHNVCQTWRRAYMTCAAEGGHLAIINSPTEAELLKELYAKHPASNIFCKYKDTTMVGFLDWSKDGFWFTIHSETLEEAGYSKWNNGTPDNNKLGTLGQHCGGMTRNGLLNDVWCDTVPFSFICEKNPPIPLY